MRQSGFKKSFAPGACLSRGGSGAYGANMARNGRDVNVDPWGGAILDAIEVAFSAVRFAKGL